jgi:outer membrane murein-binding lipoprotein Lpp
MPRPIRYLLAAVAAVLLLSGCANTYLLESQVQSFSQIATLPAQPTYRFERSLSQQADPTQQALEALADNALHTAGLRRDDAAPHFTVQVGAHAEQVLSPYADPYWGGGWGVGFGGRHGGFGFGGPWPMDSYWFRREVSVLIRELPSNRLVYETHAFSDGPILDNRVVLPAMFDAAMQGFPNPPPGPRRIDIQLGATH